MEKSAPRFVCAGCREKTVAFAVRHSDARLSLYCSKECAARSTCKLSGRIAPVADSKELIVTRLTVVAPEGSADGDVVNLPVGMTVFHGISDGKYPWTTLREFSYVSNNLHPSIGAGIAEKTSEYQTNIFCARLFELELRRPVKLILNNQGGHAVKIERTDELDRDYGTNNDGYIGSQGEEELRLRKEPFRDLALVASDFFPTAALMHTEVYVDAVPDVVAGDESNGDIRWGRWTVTKVLGFVIETLPFVDRVFSYDLLRQIRDNTRITDGMPYQQNDTRTNDRRASLDARMMGIYWLVRSGRKSRTFVAFEEDSEKADKVNILNPSWSIKCHEHPNLDRVVSSFLVTAQVSTNNHHYFYVLGGGAVSRRGHESLEFLAQLVWKEFIEYRISKTQGNSVLPVSLLVPYSLTYVLAGSFTNENTRETYGFEFASAFNTFYVHARVYESAGLNARYPNNQGVYNIPKPSPSVREDALTAMYWVGSTPDVFGNRRDAHPTAILRHAAQVRSTGLLMHALTVAMRLPPDTTNLPEFVALAFADMRLTEHPDGEVDWLLDHIGAGWFRDVQQGGRSTVLPSKVEKLLTFSIVAQLINRNWRDSSGLTHERLLSRYSRLLNLLKVPRNLPPAAMSITVAAALATSVSDWTVFITEPRLATPFKNIVFELPAGDRDNMPEQMVALAQVKTREQLSEVPWSPVALTFANVRDHTTSDIRAFRWAMAINQLVNDSQVSLQVFSDVLDVAYPTRKALATFYDTDTLAKLSPEAREAYNQARDPNAPLDNGLLGTILTGDPAKIELLVVRRELWASSNGPYGRDALAPSEPDDYGGVMLDGYSPAMVEGLIRGTHREGVILWRARGQINQSEAIKLIYRLAGPPTSARLIDGPTAIRMLGNIPNGLGQLTVIKSRFSRPSPDDPDQRSGPLYDREEVNAVLAVYNVTDLQTATLNAYNTSPMSPIAPASPSLRSSNNSNSSSGTGKRRAADNSNMRDPKSAAIPKAGSQSVQAP